jgi:hypothetical protein
MRTDALIEKLAREAPAIRRPVEQDLVLWTGAGFILAAAGFLCTFGLRRAAATTLENPFFMLKMATVLLAAATAFPFVSAAARPGAPLPWRWIWLVPVALGIGIAADLLTQPLAQWPTRLVGENAAACLLMLPALSAAPLLLLLAGLRAGAPLRPGRAGATAGVFAGALGALLYATHCTDDSPLFVATWYSLGIGIVALAGAAIGRVVLRW